MNLRQAALVGGLVSDFQKSTSWTTDFGSHVAPQATLIAMCLGTSMLLGEYANSRAWATYIAAVRALCVDSLVVQLEALGMMFRAALTQNPGLAQSYPDLQLYLSARASTGAKIRASKKKAAAAATTPAAAGTKAGG